jgi:hypothetical protein
MSKVFRLLEIQRTDLDRKPTPLRGSDLAVTAIDEGREATAGILDYQEV